MYVYLYVCMFVYLCLIVCRYVYVYLFCIICLFVRDTAAYIIAYIIITVKAITMCVEVLHRRFLAQSLVYMYVYDRFYA